MKNDFQMILQYGRQSWGNLLAFILVVLWASQVHAEQVVVVVLDDSGSMQELMATSEGTATRLAAAKRALFSVIQNLPEDTKFGVRLLNGDQTGTNLIPLGVLNREQALARISQVSSSGSTPLGAAMRAATDELIAFRKQHVYGAYRLLIITDGEASDPELVSAYLPMILSRGLSVDVIGVAMKRDHQLASSVHSYRNVNDAASFEKAVTEILAESSDSQDSSSDFDLIAGLPDELAAQAIDALTRVDNSPIAKSTTDTPAITAYSNLPPATPAPESTIDIDFGLGCCSMPCFATVFLVILIIYSMLRSKKRSR